MRILRSLFAVAAVLFVAGVVFQVFLAGMFLFADGERQSHIEFGYTLVLVPVVCFALAVLARPGRGTLGIAAALWLVTWIQPILPWFAKDVPIVAALHPVNALLILWLGVTLARRAVVLARASAAVPSPQPSGAPVGQA